MHFTTPNTTETQIQQNTIALLKAMGWQFIAENECSSIEIIPAK